MIPTLLGITIAVFSLTQILPGGPVEQYMARLRESQAATGVVTSVEVTARERERIKKIYGFDRPPVERYVRWLWGAIRLDFGDSYAYQEPVWDVVKSRMPVSLFFGITSFTLSYLICIPLGFHKSLRHGTPFDMSTSVVIFAGYVIPGFVLGLLLILFFSGGNYLDWFPMSNIVSDNFESLSFLEKIGDFLHHMILPTVCYMASEFAFLTLLMKNSLLDEMNKDYIRTALTKGSSFRNAVRRHALRNAFIPIATRLSEVTTLMFAGALLIEKVFNIDGMGLLMYNSILDRDYPVVMGVIFIVSLLSIVGRLLSDMLYVIIDPRIRFD